MALIVLSQGNSSSIPSTDNENTPTNPRAHCNSGLTNNQRVFAAIYPDGNTTESFNKIPSATSIDSVFTNLSNTPGFRINCYDSLTQEGILLNASNYDADYYYFVLLYSNDANLHHFARITDILLNDTEGDAFDIYPKFGKEIPKDTQFMIFKGPLLTSPAIAFTAGLHPDLENFLMVSRPHFYFVDSLDKANELNHNTKYYMRVNEGTGSSVTLNNLNTTFVTMEDYSKAIIDNSKYSLKIKLVDNLRTLDFQSGILVSNEGTTTPTKNLTNYNECFVNARRDSLDKDTTLTNDYTGPTRYVHYVYSPNKCNIAYNVFDNVIYESVGARGSMAETKIIDNSRILPTKLKESDEYTCRHRLFRGDLSEWKKVDWDITNVAGTTLTLDVSNSVITKNLSANDEIKIGNYTCLVSSISSNTIILHSKYRLDEDTYFSLATPPVTVNDDIYRRAFNPSNNTLYTDFVLINDFKENIIILFSDTNFIGQEASISVIDIDNKLLTLTFNGDKYIDLLQYISGDYYIEIIKFSGEIETITSYKEDGQTIMAINGRNKFNKLLSPIINSDPLFSDDIIYSSNSPLNSLIRIDGDTFTFAIATTVLTTNTATTSFELVPVAGDYLYTANGLIGKVSTVATISSNLVITLTAPSYIAIRGEQIFKENDKNYIFNKALSSSTKATDKVTSLSGASIKGAVFIGGNAISSTGVKVSSLINSSVKKTKEAIAGTNPTTTNPREVGFSLFEPSQVLDSPVIQSRFKDEFSGTCDISEHTSKSSCEEAGGVWTFTPVYSEFDTVNTLLDFEVVSKVTKGSESILTLAPYMPITLGHQVRDTPSATTYSLITTEVEYATNGGTCSNPIYSGYGMSHICNLGGNTWSGPSGNMRSLIRTTSIAEAYQLKKGDAIFAGDATNKTFIGYYVRCQEENFVRTNLSFGDTDDGRNYTNIELDRDILTDARPNTDNLYKGTSPVNHRLNFINGAHLLNGKIVSRPHSKVNSDGLVPLNYETYNSIDIVTKYGDSSYLLNNMSIGQFNKLGFPMTLNFLGIDFPIGSDVYKQNSNLNYSSSAYKLKPKFSGIAYQFADKTSSNTDKHRDIDLRGWGGPTYDLFGGYDLNEPYGERYHYPSGVGNRTKAGLSHYDDSAHRLFLYVNSDKLPYSSKRTDSLMNQTRALSEYSAVLIDNNKTKDIAELLDNTTSGNLLKLEDKNTQSISITSEEDISTLKRFSMMRLTELCVDWAYNVINPENYDLKMNEAENLPSIRMRTMSLLGTLDVSATATAQATTKEVVFTTAVGGGSSDTLAITNELFVKMSDLYYYLGTISTNTFGADKTNWVLQDKWCKNPVTGNDYAIDVSVYMSNTKSMKINGMGEQSSAVLVNESLHFQKSMIVNDTSTYFSAVGGQWELSWGTMDIPTMSHIILPVKFENGFSSSHQLFDSDYVKYDILGARILNDLMDRTITDYMSDTRPVVLDVYQFEHGAYKYTLLDKGTSVPLIKDGEAINMPTLPITDPNSQVYHLSDFTLSDERESRQTIFVKGWDDTHRFAAYINAGQTADSEQIGAYARVNGAVVAYRPRLMVGSGSASTPEIVLPSSNGNLYYRSYASGGRNSWVATIDISGCYLIEESGTNIDDILKSVTSTSASADYSREMNRNVIAEEGIIYVISHELDGSSYKIITDKPLPYNKQYRVMQPNEQFMYDFFPKEIYPNVLSDKYTKVAGENKVYNIKNSYEMNEGISTGDLSTGKVPTGAEGVLSMYVVIDTDKQSSDDYLVIRDYEDIIGSTLTSNSLLKRDTSYNVFISDGDNKDSITITTKYFNQFKRAMEFSKALNLKGAVSISETFTIKTNTKIEVIPKRLLLGSGVKISEESDILLNDLLESNNLSFDHKLDEYGIYYPNRIKGKSLFTITNEILSKKEKDIIYLNNEFKIISKRDSTKYANILLSDVGPYKIFSYEKRKSLFKFYNEIIVYGASHRGTRKDIRSIKKIGKKTLESWKPEFISQSEVDTEARKLLLLHSKLNERLEITCSSDNLGQLKAGDLILAEIRQENIYLAQYKVLQITHNLQGLMTLELGEYFKGLEDQFSELILQNKEVVAEIRSDKFNDRTLTLDLLNNFKINPIRLLIRKRTQSGSGVTIGFGTVLNTSSTALGFEGGATIVLTNLVEEDL